MKPGLHNHLEIDTLKLLFEGKHTPDKEILKLIHLEYPALFRVNNQFKFMKAGSDEGPAPIITSSRLTHGASAIDLDDGGDYGRQASFSGDQISERENAWLNDDGYSGGGAFDDYLDEPGIGAADVPQDGGLLELQQEQKFQREWEIQKSDLEEASWLDTQDLDPRELSKRENKRVERLNQHRGVYEGEILKKVTYDKQQTDWFMKRKKKDQDDQELVFSQLSQLADEIEFYLRPPFSLWSLKKVLLKFSLISKYNDRVESRLTDLVSHTFRLCKKLNSRKMKTFFRKRGVPILLEAYAVVTNKVRKTSEFNKNRNQKVQLDVVGAVKPKRRNKRRLKKREKPLKKLKKRKAPKEARQEEGSQGTSDFGFQEIIGNLDQLDPQPAPQPQRSVHSHQGQDKEEEDKRESEEVSQWYKRQVEELLERIPPQLVGDPDEEEEEQEQEAERQVENEKASQDRKVSENEERDNQRKENAEEVAEISL